MTELPKDEQVFYNMISGIHTSISSHVSQFYRDYSKQGNSTIEEPLHFNLTVYENRVLNYPERVKNLIFIYRLVISALVKHSKFFRYDLSLHSNNFTEDMQARALLNSLLNNI